MPFEVLETLSKANMPPTAPISYMRPKQHGKNAGKPPKAGTKPKLTISIPTTICGTSKAETFQLLLGSGADAGKLRIKGCKDKSKGSAPVQLMHIIKFNFGYVPKLGDDIFDGERLPVRKIADDEFEIDAPASWFEPSEQ